MLYSTISGSSALRRLCSCSLICCSLSSLFSSVSVPRRYCFAPLPPCISPASIYSTRCPITYSLLAQSPLLLFCSFGSTWSSFALKLSNELKFFLSIMEWNDENESCPMKLECGKFIYRMMYDTYIDNRYIDR